MIPVDLRLRDVLRDLCIGLFPTLYLALDRQLLKLRWSLYRRNRV
jgi:hypothetical protein